MTDSQWGPESDAADVIAEWWVHEAADDVRMVTHKLSAYGSLRVQAQALVDMANVPADKRNETLATEMVLASYVGGKLNRIVTALARGEVPSTEHWRDLVCYAMMARWVDESGTWP